MTKPAIINTGLLYMTRPVRTQLHTNIVVWLTTPTFSWAIWNKSLVQVNRAFTKRRSRNSTASKTNSKCSRKQVDVTSLCCHTTSIKALQCLLRGFFLGVKWSEREAHQKYHLTRKRWGATHFPHMFPVPRQQRRLDRLKGRWVIHVCERLILWY